MAAVGSPWCIATKIRAVAPWGSRKRNFPLSEAQRLAWRDSSFTLRKLAPMSRRLLFTTLMCSDWGDSDRGAALHWALEPTTPQGTRACLHATHIKLGLVYEHANMTTSVHVDEQCLRLATVCRPSGGAGVECPHMSVRERYMAHFAAPEKSTLV